MDVIALIARILFTVVFVGAGIGHLTATEAMTGYAASKRLPQPRLGVLVSGLYMLVAAVMLVLGIWPDLAALALVPFLLITAVVFHNFWQETDAQARSQDQIHFTKDISLAGGALALFVLYGAESHPGLVLLGPLFSL